MQLCVLLCISLSTFCCHLQAFDAKVTGIKIWQYLHSAVFFEGRASVIRMITTTYNPLTDIFTYWAFIIKRSPGGPLYGSAQLTSVPNRVYDMNSPQGYNRLLADSAVGFFTVFNLIWTMVHVFVMLRNRARSSVRALSLVIPYFQAAAFLCVHVLRYVCSGLLLHKRQVRNCS